MTHATPSIYPDFLKAGIGKLQSEGVLTRDLMTLFSALENFQRELKLQERMEDICEVTHRYVSGLELFEAIGFYLVNPEDFDFKIYWCRPEEQRPQMENLVRQQIKSGRFAWALRNSSPVIFEAAGSPAAVQGVFHSLGVASHTAGMFCGLLRRQPVTSQEIPFSLLSVFLGACAHALVTARHMEGLKQKILAANRDLQRTLQENEVLARIPAESPAPMFRASQNGRILYSNQPGLVLLGKLGFHTGDLLTGDWLEKVNSAFTSGLKREFEIRVEEQVFSFVLAAIPEAGYANFYGADITARKQAEADRERLILELQEALASVKTLSGLLPICAWCKKIRDDSGYWKQLENFIEVHSGAVFSHGVCPECLTRLSADLKKIK